eukprot:scaffold89848_cov21-Tisochrysis_lutea.AAC.4
MAEMAWLEFRGSVASSLLWTPAAECMLQRMPPTQISSHLRGVLASHELHQSTLHSPHGILSWHSPHGAFMPPHHVAFISPAQGPCEP